MVENTVVAHSDAQRHIDHWLQGSMQNKKSRLQVVATAQNATRMQSIVKPRTPSGHHAKTHVPTAAHTSPSSSTIPSSTSLKLSNASLNSSILSCQNSISLLT